MSSLKARIYGDGDLIMMRLEEAKIGQHVVYFKSHPSEEYGVIHAVRSPYIFVKFYHVNSGPKTLIRLLEENAKACNPSDLKYWKDWIEGERWRDIVE